MFTLSVRFIISQENVRSKRLKILAARLAKAKVAHGKSKSFANLEAVSFRQLSELCLWALVELFSD